VSENDPRERAYSRTLEASAREGHITAALARRSGRPIEPGDLCVLPATAAYPVEWALVERGLDDPGQLLAVPADTFPPAGTGDVEIPESDPAGPLRLRCRQALWVNEKAFEQARRTGVLAARWLREAGARHEALEAGPLPPASLAEEVEADPEYRDWERDVLVPAREALEREASGAVAGPRRIGGPAIARPWRSLPARLAAVFLLAAVGLGIWNARLQDQLDQPFAGEPTLLKHERNGGDLVEVAPKAKEVWLAAQLEQPVTGGRIEIEDADGRKIRLSEPIDAENEFVFFVPRRQLPNGEYRILLVAADGGKLDSWSIDVRTREPQP
jgi:hypothetical protein